LGRGGLWLVRTRAGLLVPPRAAPSLLVGHRRRDALRRGRRSRLLVGQGNLEPLARRHRRLLPAGALLRARRTQERGRAVVGDVVDVHFDRFGRVASRLVFVSSSGDEGGGRRVGRARRALRSGHREEEDASVRPAGLPGLTARRRGGAPVRVEPKTRPARHFRYNPPVPTATRWYVYLLRCGDGTLYAGATTDVESRLAAHREGRGARYTRGRAPLSLVLCEPRPALAALQGVGPPVPRDRGTWYGWQTLIADATAGALALVGATPRNDAALTAASALYLLGGPAMHWSRRLLGRGFASLGRRVVFPLGLGLVFALAGGSGGGGG